MTADEALALAGSAAAAAALNQALHQQGLIDHLDEHLRKMGTTCPTGSPDPNDPDQDPVKGWIKEIKAAIKNLKQELKKMPKNKEKRKPVEEAIKRGEDALKAGDNSQQRQVAEAMQGLKSAFGMLLADKEVAEELAFNCAEIFVEMPEIRSRFEAMIQSGKATEDDIRQIEYMLAVHWAYHIGEIKRLLDIVNS